VGRLDPLEGDEQLPVEKINTFAWGSVSWYNRLWLTDFLFLSVHTYWQPSNPYTN
jgi:hypothetical protein